MTRPLSVLIIEDSEDDALLIARALKRGGYTLTSERVATAKDLRALLEQRTWDVIIADYTLPGFSALAALDIVQNLDYIIPFIIVSGTISKTSAVAAMKAGAHDYVMKDNLTRLVPAIERELAEARARQEQREVERERENLQVQIQEQAQQMRHIVNTIPEGVLLLGTQGQVLQANPVAQKDILTLAHAHVGDTLTHLGDHKLHELLTSPPKGLWHQVKAKSRSFEIIAKPVETGPATSGWVLVIRDVTRENEIVQRMQLQDRLAAVGQLAAGIAHDFNNIMTVITLYTHLVHKDTGLPERSRERLAVISQQAGHASKLIEQILDFSRSTVVARHPLDLIPFLKEFVKLIKRTLPENINIQLIHEPEPHTINADPTRMHQMFMNLVLNARDAMPGGGTLTIELKKLRNTLPPPISIAAQRAKRWLQVSVQDTGTGIPDEILPQVFDPFFTTKPPSVGTGLGLSQVYGILKLHEGEVTISTEVGEGTTFNLYFPVFQPEEEETTVQETESLTQGYGETILVVEDDAVTLEALVDSLALLNYQTQTASNGQEALAFLEKHHRDIALLLSDVVMPEMGGIALLKALRQQGIKMRAVMLTGHPLEHEFEELSQLGISGWLQKPPSMEQLADIIAQALRTKGS